jgi:SMC interacting uncharacterized protein involved in chromosome segregation
MNKLRRWLFGRYFPAEAKEQIAQLQREIVLKNAEIDNLKAYIDGLQDGIRSQRRVVIQNNTKG